MKHMTATDLATIISGAIAIVGVVGAVISRAIKHWLHESLVELRPNGGGSTYDLVRKAARDAERAAHAAERAADQALDVREQVDTMIERVSNLEQIVVAWTPRKAAVKKAPARKSTR